MQDLIFGERKKRGRYGIAEKNKKWGAEIQTGETSYAK